MSDHLLYSIQLERLRRNEGACLHGFPEVTSLDELAALIIQAEIGVMLDHPARPNTWAAWPSSIFSSWIPFLSVRNLNCPEKRGGLVLQKDWAMGTGSKLPPVGAQAHSRGGPVSFRPCCAQPAFGKSDGYRQS